VWRLVRTPRLNVPAVRFTVTPEIGTTFDTSAPAVAISSDGTRVAWSACDDRSCRLYVRPLSSVDAERVPGTDGARMPFFSPDGRWLGFFADGRLKKVATDGGAAVSLADAPEPLGGTWVDHEIVFAASAFSGLIAVPASGGEPRSITVPLQASGEVRHAWPFVVPGSDLLGFTIQRTVTRLSTGDLGVLSRISGPASAWRTLLAGVGTARAGAPDVFVFSRDDDLQAVLFDPVRMAIAGEPRTVASGAGSRQGGPHVALSADGSVVLATGAPADAASLLWWSPDASSAVGGERPRLGDASLSPDGRRIAGVSNTAGRDDLWIAELDRGAAIRVTHAGVNTAPVWSADGRTLYFASRTNGVFEIWSRRLDESAQGARVYGGGRHSIPAAVSPDGRTLAFIRPEETTRADIWLLPLDGAPAGPLVAGPFDEIAPAFSPRADLLAYQSAESGRWEVYVRRIGADHRALVSTDGGTRPFWSPDGSAIYFQSGNRLMRSTIESSASGLTAGAVASVASLAGSSVVGMARDGRLLLERPARPPASAIVALGWIRDVRQLLGPPATVMPR
jgi:serine/threonine-protein kinase